MILKNIISHRGHRELQKQNLLRFSLWTLCPLWLKGFALKLCIQCKGKQRAYKKSLFMVFAILVWQLSVCSVYSVVKKGLL